MILIKNYADWIPATLMEYLKTHDGDTVPVWQPEKWQGNPMLDAAREQTRIGYSHRHDHFQQFTSQTKGMVDFELPVIPDDDRRQLWWIIKLYPGQLQPIHFDPHMLEAKNPKRYSMFLEDWKPGHIFVWNDKYISNYQAGDLYIWDDPMMLHGVSNIGHDIRYTLQITTYD
jgi:hypothetical protein